MSDLPLNIWAKKSDTGLPVWVPNDDDEKTKYTKTEKLIEELEGMLRDTSHEFIEGVSGSIICSKSPLKEDRIYNQALDDVIKLLRGENESSK